LYGQTNAIRTSSFFRGEEPMAIESSTLFEIRDTFVIFEKIWCMRTDENLCSVWGCFFQERGCSLWYRKLWNNAMVVYFCMKQFLWRTEQKIFLQSVQSASCYTLVIVIKTISTESAVS